MEAVFTPRLSNGEVRCPTCGAVQEWAETCRRCKCELTLLQRVSAGADAHRRRALRALRAGRADAALTQARQWYALTPDPAAARLLALCHLLDGNWADALRMARIAASQSNSDI